MTTLLTTLRSYFVTLNENSKNQQNIGFLPMISNAPKDHHSLLQLYLDGPKDKIFYIFHEKERKGNKLNLKNVIFKLGNGAKGWKKNISGFGFW